MKQLLPAPLAGILTVFAFAPYGLWWLAPLTLAVLFHLLLDTTPKRAFLHGWLFGAGLLCTGLSWIENSMSVYAGMPIGQLIYFHVDGEIERFYNKKKDAKYNARTTHPVESMMWKNKF